MLGKYLNFRFIHNNVKRYWKYVNEWIDGLNESQLVYFEKEIHNLIKEGTYGPER